MKICSCLYFFFLCLAILGCENTVIEEYSTMEVTSKSISLPNYTGSGFLNIQAVETQNGIEKMSGISLVFNKERGRFFGLKFSE